jgi:hypothetical protein
MTARAACATHPHLWPGPSALPSPRRWTEGPSTASMRLLLSASTEIPRVEIRKVAVFRGFSAKKTQNRGRPGVGGESEQSRMSGGAALSSCPMSELAVEGECFFFLDLRNGTGKSRALEKHIYI